LGEDEQKAFELLKKSPVASIIIMKKILLIFPLLLFLGKVWAQNQTITGNVTGEDGESLPGVNILVKDTIVGTVSDVDGNYTITVESSQ